MYLGIVRKLLGQVSSPDRHGRSTLHSDGACVWGWLDLRDLYLSIIAGFTIKLHRGRNVKYLRRKAPKRNNDRTKFLRRVESTKFLGPVDEVLAFADVPLIARWKSLHLLEDLIKSAL
jgi:hypothetical protein